MLLGGCGLRPLNFEKQSGEILYSFKDATGKQFDFREKPNHIVSLDNSIDEILLDIVDYKRIAALTHLADDETLCCAADKAKNVKGRSHGSNIEQILSYRPDVVILSNWVGSDFINSLRQYNMKVVVLHAPQNYREIMQFIRDVAAVVGEAEAGGQLTRDLQHRAEYFRNCVVSKVGEKNLRSVLALSTMGVMGQRGTFSDICYLAGVRNILENVSVPARMQISDEKLVEYNPDVLLLPSWDYSKNKNMNEYRQKILQNPAYKNMNAIRNGRVYQIHDQYLYSTSQYSIKAIEEIAKVCYPEIFKE